MAGQSLSGSRESRVSLKSVKSAANQLPRARACPWVSGWFTVPQFIIKMMEMLLAVCALLLVCLWSSEGVSVADLHLSSHKFRDRLYFYIGICIISFLYSIAMATLGLGGFKMPPNAQTFLAGGLLFLWVLGAPIMSATVVELSHTLFARKAQLDTLFLDIATVMGFLCMLVFVCDILLGFLALRSVDESHEFAGETEMSKSVMFAVKSGKSFAEAKLAAVTRVKSRGGRGGEQKDEPITDTSPLKSHEEAPSRREGEESGVETML